jgi:serine/threonine-protein kinase
VLPPDLSAAVSTERFRREILLAAGLQHAHIVPVLTAGTSEGLPYFTMPFVEGESLRARLEREGTVPVRECVAILRDVSQALAYAHERGVIHRDIKPDNILLSGGVAMVTDFGVAKALSAAGGTSTLTSVGLALGTPAYMAPEQGTGDPSSDQRADIYALGAVGYEMLCGRTLFPGRSSQATLMAHAVEAPKPVSECRPDTPRALAALIMQCLEKDPARRPTSAAALLLSIDSVISGGTAVHFAVPRRRRAVAAGLAVLAAMIVLGGYFAVKGRAPAATERSIAVLPFVTLGGHAEDDYFGDGMAEELITALNKVPGLRVAARSSAFAFKGKPDDAKIVGRQLNVATVLGGTVQREGKHLRVNARLEDAVTGYQIWAESYDRDETDVFAVQDSLTRDIVGALQLRLTPGGGAAIAQRGTTNIEAYNLYLHGRFFYEKRSEEGLVKAAENFSQAIALDSNYAAAYAGLADSYSLLSTFGFRAPREIFPKAKVAALRALALDSTLAEAHTSLGFIQLFYDFDYENGYRELTRAIELDPQYAPARLFRSWYYVATGQLDAAVRDVQRARADDPLSLIINTRLGTMLFWTRAYDSSASQLRHTLELDSTYALAHSQLSRAYLMLGHCKDAIREAEKYSAVVGNYESANLGYSAAVCGDTALARRELQMRLDEIKKHYVSADVIARLYAGMGEKTQALDWLEKAYDERTWSLFLLKVEPMYDNLRGEPRFQALVRKMRLK